MYTTNAINYIKIDVGNFLSELDLKIDSNLESGKFDNRSTCQTTGQNQVNMSTTGQNVPKLKESRQQNTA